VERVRGFGKGKPKQEIKQESQKEEEQVKTEAIVAEEIKKESYPKITDSGVIFRYQSKTAQKVFVAGTFNNWDGRKGIMVKNIEGIWNITLPIKPGKYTYKYKVDGVWILDPDNPVSADDGKGGRVSVVIIR